MPDSTLPSPPAEIVDDDALVTTLRREVVAAELQILELKDRMLAVNTDRADAVALLGQAELLLEQKISYIITLDQALNSRIRELEADRSIEAISQLYLTRYEETERVNVRATLEAWVLVRSARGGA